MKTLLIRFGRGSSDVIKRYENVTLLRSIMSEEGQRFIEFYYVDDEGITRFSLERLGNFEQFEVV